MRIGFAGTPDFAVPCLDAACKSEHDVVVVLTQPDRPAGRGRKLTPSPIKQYAESHSIPVWQPKTLREDSAVQQLAELELDLLIVVAYGLILPQEILDTPKQGCWNVHASLLPRWRGAAPIQRAILAGDKQTGVCLMEMEAGLDTGPVLACRTTAIESTDTGSTLHDRLAQMGGALLREVLMAPMNYTSTPQAEGACYAHKLSKEEAQLDWQKSAAELARTVRAFNAWPVAWADLYDERLRIWEAEAVGASADPGEIVISGDQILVGTGSGSLRLITVQRPGRKPQPAREYVQALQAKASQ